MLGRLALVGALAIACSKNPAPPAPTAPSPNDVEKFAAAFIAAKVPCDPAKMQTLVDLDVIVARGVQDSKLSSEIVRAIRGGIVLDQMLCNTSLGANASAKYLRTLTIDGTPRPLIRVIGDNGFTYETIELDRRADKTVAVDIYNYAAGTTSSSLVRSMIMALDKDQLAASLIKQMNQQRYAGKYGEAYETFNALSADVRTTRELMVVELQLAMHLDEARATNAFERFAAAYPSDPSLRFLAIQLHSLRKHWDKVLAAIDRFDREIGGDPFLEMQRADAYDQMGKPDDAIAAVKRATKLEPTLEGAWWLLLAQQSATGRFADAVVTLTEMQKYTKVDVARLGEDDRFKALVASAELQAIKK